MIHACTKDQIFLCHLKFLLWVSQTSPPGDVFRFYVLFTHFRSCDNIILLENWCFFQLSSHLYAYLYACMYCTHNLQTVKLEILLRLGKQNMQAQDFYCRNHFGHHGRKKKFWLLILQSVRGASLGTCVWIIWRKLWFFYYFMFMLQGQLRKTFSVLPYMNLFPSPWILKYTFLSVNILFPRTNELFFSGHQMVNPYKV